MSTLGVSLILGLADARRSRKAGGKAADLSRLIEARFPVPRGFVVSADAYRSHLWGSGARGLASSAADPEARQRLRSALESAPMPPDVWEAIEQAYRRLAFQTGEAEPMVRVRASVVDEHSPGEALRESYQDLVDISGCDALRRAVTSVWASLWSEEAYHSRKHPQTTGAEPAMAVIIQQMAAADQYGRVSTADTRTGDPRVVVVRCSTDSHSAAARQICCTVDLADFSVDYSPDESQEPSRDLIDRLVERAIIAEEVFGSRLEMEWALDGDRLWITDIRKLDRLPWFFPVESMPQDGSRMRRATIRPISHFAASGMLGKSGPADSDHGRVKLINGYVYLQQHSFTGDRAVRPIDLRRAEKVLEQWQSGAGREIEALARRIIDGNPCAMKAGELAEYLADASLNADRAVCLLEQLRGEGAVVMESTRAMLVSSDAARLSSDIFGGIPDPAVERDARLQEIADRFALAESSGRVDDQQWVRGFRNEVRDFARDYGFCFRDAGDAHDPSSWKSWIENDEPVMRMIAAIMRKPNRPTTVTLHCAAFERAQSAAAEAVKMFRGAARRRFEHLLKLSRGWLKSTSEAEQAAALALTSLRLVMTDAGRRLAKSGTIDQPDDVWQLSLHEIIRAIEQHSNNGFAALVSARKHRVWLQNRLAAPRVLPPDRIAAQHIAPTPDARLKGLGVSPGIAVGKARVVNSIQEASELQQGEILVVRESTPAWTPFLTVAGGLISEDGSDCWSQASLMKDYGIPAVVNCEGVLSAVKSGHRLKVDGSGGTVEL